MYVPFADKQLQSKQGYGVIVPILLSIMVFLTLLFVVLYVSIIRKRYKVSGKVSLSEEDLEELEVVDEDMDEAVRVIENMQLMELEELDMIPVSEAVSDETASDEAVVLENITNGTANFVGDGFLFWRPFAAFSHNPALLESVGEIPEVIYEQDGIHYIKKNYFIDKNTEEKLDTNFMKLVESVVGKT